MASAVDLPGVRANCSDICPVVSRKWLSLSITNFTRHFPGIDKLMPRYPSERSLVLSTFGMAITLAFFHTFGKHRSAIHLLYSANQNFGKYLCRRLTMLPSMPSGPGHLFSSSLLITSSTLCSVKFGSVWSPGTLDLLFALLCSFVFRCHCQ